MIQSLQDHPVGNLLDGTRKIVFVIPQYQREYSWSKQQWEALFDDLTENHAGYFLGSFICIDHDGDHHSDKPKESELVDGQQRLTTISIIYAALYSYLTKNLDNLDKEQKLDLSNLKRKLVLKDIDAQLIYPQAQNNNSKDYTSLLHEIGLIKRNVDKVANAGNRRIYKAFNYFISRIEALVSESGRGLTPAFYFLEKLNSALMVKIGVKNHSDAFSLFESLNNRGLPLSAVDLIKSKLLAVLEKNDPGQINYYVSEWDKILADLGEENQERFFRHFYNAFRDKLNSDFKSLEVNKGTLGALATRTNLFDIYEKLINFNARDLVIKLCNASNIYSSLILNNQKGAHSNFEDELKNLDRIQGSPSHLLLLNLLTNRDKYKLKDEELNEIIKLLVKFFVRRNLTDSPPTRDLTRLFMNIVEGIKEAEGIDAVNKVKHYLVSVSTDDQVFKAKLSGSIYLENTDVTRFILCSLEEKSRTSESKKDLWEKPNKQYLWTIEHVFPQGKNIPKSWVEMVSKGIVEEAERLQEVYVHKLGNLTLSGFNSTLSNDSFQAKKEKVDDKGRAIGFKNGIKLNEYIVKQEEWTPQNIEERTHNLVDETIKLFAF